MRFFLFGILLFPFFSKSQVVISAIGGYNNAVLINSPQTYSQVKNQNGGGWQFGATTEMQMSKKLFVYSGIVYQSQQFQSQYSSCCYINETDVYKAKFLNVPFGAGYKMNLNKNLSLKLIGGGYANIGVGGTLRSYGAMGDIIYSPFDYERKIEYGNDASNDLRTINWGVQFNGRFQYKRIFADLGYSLGVSNILPNNKSSFGMPNEYKLNALFVNIGYELFHLK